MEKLYKNKPGTLFLTEKKVVVGLFSRPKALIYKNYFSKV